MGRRNSRSGRFSAASAPRLSQDNYHKSLNLKEKRTRCPTKTRFRYPWRLLLEVVAHKDLSFATDAFLDKDAVGVAGPLADALFEFDGELRGIGRSHHIAELGDEAVGGVVAGDGSNRGPVIVMGGVVPVSEHLADLRLAGRAGAGDVDGSENQIALAEVFAGVEVHVGEQPVIVELVEAGFGVDEIGIGDEFEAVFTRPVARFGEKERLRQDGREMQAVLRRDKAHAAFDPVEADGLAGGAPPS
jgi:hypothetical protein